MARILNVDRSSFILQQTSDELEKGGHEVSRCSTIQRAKHLMSSEDYDVLITSIRFNMAVEGGREIIRAAIAQNIPHIVVNSANPRAGMGIDESVIIWEDKIIIGVLKEIDRILSEGDGDFFIPDSFGLGN